MASVPCNFRTTHFSIGLQKINLVDLEVPSGRVSIDLDFSFLGNSKTQIVLRPKLVSGNYGSREDYDMTLIDSDDDDIGELIVTTKDIYSHNVIGLSQLMVAFEQLSRKDFRNFILHEYVKAFEYNLGINATITYEEGSLSVTLDFERYDETMRSSKFLVERWDSRSSANLVPAMKQRAAV